MAKSKLLVAYFSRGGMNYVNGSIVKLTVGNSRVCAELVAKITGGDLFEIAPETSYPEDYYACTEVAKQEFRSGSRPPILGKVENMAEYGAVVLCHPNWWGTMPMAVWTFLEAHDFAGKRIAPLCTHEGSGMSRSPRDIAALCPQSVVLEGLAIRGSKVRRAEGDIRRWIEELRL
ncbi:MAG: flavodoxin [Candidatus Limiplasma sp.]|nr:flavodoxin [Candidatus Limiplasma sp.]